MDNKQTTYGALVLTKDTEKKLVFLPSITSRDRRLPISPKHLDEAAAIIEKYPTPESLIAKIQWAYDQDTDVGYTLFKRLKDIYLRGVQIRAWSTSIATHFDRMLQDEEATIVNGIAKELGLLEFSLDDLTVPGKMMPLFFLPYSSTYLELYHRLRQHDGSGMIGFLTSGANNAFLFSGMSDAKSVYDWLSTSRPVGNVCVFYKDDTQLVYRQGELVVTMPLEVAFVYIAIMFNSSRDTTRYVLKKKQYNMNPKLNFATLSGDVSGDAGVNYTSRLLSDFYIGSGYEREYPYRVFILDRDKADDKDRDDIGDFWGYGVCEYYADPKNCVNGGKIIQIGSEQFMKIHRRGYTSTINLDRIIEETLKKRNSVFTKDSKVDDLIKFLQEKYIPENYTWDDFWKLEITSLLNNQVYREVR